MKNKQLQFHFFFLFSLFLLPNIKKKKEGASMSKKFNFVAPVGPRVVSLGLGMYARQDILLKMAGILAQKNHAIALNLNNNAYPLDLSRNILKVIGFQTQASIVLDLMHYNFYRFLEHSPILPIVQIKPHVQYIMQNEEEFSKDIVYDIQHRWNFFLSMKMNAAGLLFHESNQITVDPINFQLLPEQGQSVQNFKFFIQPSFFPQALDEVLENEREFTKTTDLGWVRVRTLKYPNLSISVPLLSLSKLKREVDSIRKDSKSKLEDYSNVLNVGIGESRRFWIHEIIEIKQKIEGNPSLYLYESDLCSLLKRKDLSSIFIRI